MLRKDSTDEIKSRTKVIQREAPPTRFRIFFKQNESSESTQSSTSYSSQKYVVLTYPDLCQRGLISESRRYAATPTNGSIHWDVSYSILVDRTN